MSQQARRGRLQDLHDIAMSMPFTKQEGSSGNPVYQVGGKSFLFFRNPRPDAVDAQGERLPDVIVIWVSSEDDKQSLVQDECSPFFTTAHFNGHLSVLVRAQDVGQLTLAELTEVVQDAWLCRASTTRAHDWLLSSGHAGQDRRDGAPAALPGSAEGDR